MLIEVKVKTSRTSEDKTKKSTETYIIDKEFFAQAEFKISEELEEEKRSHLLDNYEIVSLKQSSIKEIDEQSMDDAKSSFMATLRDVFHEDDGTEKYVKYKVLLWAEDLIAANRRALELSHQGYDMLIEGIKQVDWIYLKEEEENGERGSEEAGGEGGQG